MEHLSDYIRVYEDTLDKNFCNQLIAYFEGCSQHHQHIDCNGAPTFTQLNLTEQLGPKHEYSTILAQACKEYVKWYKEDLNIKFFPEKHSWEMFRIKKYKPDGCDRFDEHVDVGDSSSARRFLAFFIYLNDVDVGGQTIFTGYNGDINIIKPKSGRMVIFPPLWMFPHSGQRPISGNKYIISGYFHYL